MESTRSQATGPGGRSLLVVDSSAPIRTALCAGFSLYGYRVLEASSASAASLIVENNHALIVAVLLDEEALVNDPCATLEFLQVIAPVPCYVMSAGSIFPAEDLIRLGARAVFTKPFRSFMEIVRVITDGAESSQHISHPAHPTVHLHLEKASVLTPNG